jgi:octaprenyl-diphosphate synthase
MTVSEDMFLNIMNMKSASQIECACHVGALLANANQKLVEIFSIFGNNLGMAAQITNDIQGIICGSDITKRTISLPVIYALTHANNEIRNQLSLAFDRQAQSPYNISQITDLLFSTGAIHYATIKMELYKQRALDVLSEAEVAGASVERLKLFLE